MFSIVNNRTVNAFFPIVISFPLSITDNYCHCLKLFSTVDNKKSGAFTVENKKQFQLATVFFLLYTVKNNH